MTRDGQQCLAISFPADRIEEWSLDVSEIVHHLRAVLDGLVYESLSPQAGGDVRRRCAFPMCCKEGVFEAWEKSNGAHCGAAIQKICRGYQDFERKATRPHPTRLLHELNNIDKHRLLPLTMPAVAPMPPTDPRAASQNAYRVRLLFDTDGLGPLHNLEVTRVLARIEREVVEIGTRFFRALNPADAELPFPLRKDFTTPRSSSRSGSGLAEPSSLGAPPPPPTPPPAAERETGEP